MGSIVNVLVLAIIFSLGTGSDAKGFTYAILITGCLAALALSPLGEAFFRLINGCRAPTLKEEEKLRSIFESVCQDAGLDSQKYDLFVSDEKFPNAFACGQRTVCVTFTMLANSSEEQLQGVLAHELAHHVNGDARRLVIFWVLTVIAQVIASIGGFISGIFGGDGRDGLWIASFVLSALVLSFNLLLWAPIKIGQALGSRQQEFAADAYAVEVGHGEGLHAALTSIQPLEGKPRGFMGMIYASHPKISERIKRIEAGL